MNSGSRTLADRQQGIALLLMLLTLLALGTWSGLRLSAGQDWQRRQSEQQTLLKARDLLIARALATWDAEQDQAENRPGALRCTDRNHDGSADVIGCSTRMLGRFPWRSLRSGEAFHDADGQLLWYAVNPSLADWGASSRILNSESAYLAGLPALMLDDLEVAAILIAPGRALASQASRDSQATDPTLFLEGANADADGQFTSWTSDGFNDRLLALRYEDYWPAVERLVLDAARAALLAYRDRPGCGRLPWPAAFSPELARPDSAVGLSAGLLPSATASAAPALGCASQLDLPSWLLANRWQSLIYYARAEQGAACADAGANPTCLELQSATGVTSGIHALLISAGRPIEGGGRSQHRRSNRLDDYFEGENNDLDALYESATLGENFNDQVLIVSATTSP